MTKKEKDRITFEWTETFPTGARQLLDDWANALAKQIDNPHLSKRLEVAKIESHHRGRFIHSHKGKARRQHPLRTRYTAYTRLYGDPELVGSDDPELITMEFRRVTAYDVDHSKPGMRRDVQIYGETPRKSKVGGTRHYHRMLRRKYIVTLGPRQPSLGRPKRMKII